jgi:hypothetical protein
MGGGYGCAMVGFGGSGLCWYVAAWKGGWGGCAMVGFGGSGLCWYI